MKKSQPIFNYTLRPTEYFLPKAKVVKVLQAYFATHDINATNFREYMFGDLAGFLFDSRTNQEKIEVVIKENKE